MDREVNGLRAVCTLCVYTCLVLCSCTFRLVWGEVHCYCNSPRCSSSNYMCESQLGCYSLLVDRQGDTNDPYLHGCIESITIEKCEEIARLNNETSTVPVESASQYQDLSCCFESMCNFKDGSQVNEDVEKNDDQYMNEPYEAASEQAVWFRAAVIAVPIAGACILIGLIMVAARMLRSEDKQFTKLSVNVRQRAVLRTHNAHHSTIHRAPQFLDNSRVKNINITGNKLVDPLVGRPNKITNMNNVSKVTNEQLHQQRCLNECPRLVSTTQHYEKMYRENFDVV